MDDVPERAENRKLELEGKKQTYAFRLGALGLLVSVLFVALGHPISAIIIAIVGVGGSKAAHLLLRHIHFSQITFEE